MEKIVTEPITYLEQQARNSLYFAFYKKSVKLVNNCFLKIDGDKIKEIQNFMEKVYNHVSVLDDILDGTSFRNKAPTAHLVYGLDRSLSAVLNGYYNSIYQQFSKEGPEELDYYVRSFLKNWINILKGQGVESYYKHIGQCPTEEEYLTIILGKTYGGIGFLLDYLQYNSEDKSDVETAGMKYSYFFQIYNDYINLRSKKYGRSCTDIEEGNFTFPIIHAIKSHPEDTRILNILKQKPKDDDSKKFVLSLMEKYGSFKYTFNKLLDLKNEMLECMKPFGEIPLVEEYLSQALQKIEDGSLMD